MSRESPRPRRSAKGGSASRKTGRPKPGPKARAPRGLPVDQAPAAGAAPEPRLAMRELVARSGVHRQTIHAYLRLGLLPPPVHAAGPHDTSYSPRHLELLELVRELRSARGLSLEAIRRCFAEADFEPARIRHGLTPTRLARAAPPTPADRLDARELVERAAAAPELLSWLVETGVLAPEHDATGTFYEPEALPLLSAATRLRSGGLGEEALLRAVKLAEGLAATEAAALASDALDASGGKPSLAERAEGRYQDLSELVAALRRLALRGVLRRLSEVGSRWRRFAGEAIFVPRGLFLRRYHLERELADAEAAAVSRPRDAHANLRLGRLLIGLGRYPEAAEWLARAARMAPRDDEAQAYLGLALSIDGNMDEALAASRRAVALAPESPRAHAFHGATLALHAALTAGLAQPGEVLVQALREANRSRGFAARDAREHLEALIARGRLFTVLPAGMPGQAEGVADLREGLERTAGADADEVFDIPGTAALYRMHALFYLGVSAQQEGDIARARTWLRECLTIDPSSRFAELAYDMLSSLDAGEARGPRPDLAELAGRRSEPPARR